MLGPYTADKPYEAMTADERRKHWINDEAFRSALLTELRRIASALEAANENDPLAAIAMALEGAAESEQKAAEPEEQIVFTGPDEDEERLLDELSRRYPEIPRGELWRVRP